MAGGGLELGDARLLGIELLPRLPAEEHHADGQQDHQHDRRQPRLAPLAAVVAAGRTGGATAGRGCGGRPAAARGWLLPLARLVGAALVGTALLAGRLAGSAAARLGGRLGLALGRPGATLAGRCRRRLGALRLAGDPGGRLGLALGGSAGVGLVIAPGAPPPLVAALAGVAPRGCRLRAVRRLLFVLLVWLLAHLVASPFRDRFDRHRHPAGHRRWPTPPSARPAWHRTPRRGRGTPACRPV